MTNDAGRIHPLPPPGEAGFPRPRRAFSLVEVLVAVSLLSLIVLALMAVFNSTQRAFRASVTQTDVLEGGRAAVELIAQDLRQIAPSGGTNFGPVNFFSLDNSYLPAPAYSPLIQTLPGSSVQRTNLLNYFFLLSRQNTKWIGVGYVVNATDTSPRYPLYRYYRGDVSVQNDPWLLFTNFTNIVARGQWNSSYLSHLVDGVVQLSVRASDPRGYQLTNTYQFRSGQWFTNKNILFYPPAVIAGVQRETGYYFFSNTVPASVELQLGLLEDRSLQRAQSLPYNSTAQLNFLKQQAGHVHLFRQQVTIPNLDPTAYQ